MFDEEFIKFLMTLGVGGVIAGLIFVFYRKDVRIYTDQWKGQSEMLTHVVKDNTAAVTANTEVMRSMHRRLDQLVGLQVDDTTWTPLTPERRRAQRDRP